MQRSKQSEKGPDSLWNVITAARPPKPALCGHRNVEVAIIGGGYSGLAAAHLCVERDVQPVILEANRIGWGASGRNGGVVSAKFRVAYSEIARRFGHNCARALYRMSHEALDLVERLVAEHRLNAAGFQRGGQLQCAHNERALQAITAEARWRKDNLDDFGHAEYTREEIADETRSDAFAGGVLIRTGATIQPLEYVTGLAAALEERAPDSIHEMTPVVAIHSDAGGVILTTPHGTVCAQHVIVATNGYSELSAATRSASRRLVPFRSAIIATQRLPERLDDALPSAQHSFVETRRMMRWFRKVDGRLIFGGRGAFGRRDSQAAFNALRCAMVTMYPQLSDMAIEYQWSGHVAMTMDKFPHVGSIGNRLTCCLGYNGAGIAMSTLLGRYAGRLALGETLDASLLGAERLRPIPLYPLRELATRSVAGWYQFLDGIGV